MAIPVITNDFTKVDNADTDTDWSGWGINSTKWEFDNQVYLEGAGSQALAPSATGDGGNGYDIVSGGGSTFDATSNLIMVWIKVISPSWVTTKVLHGVYIRLTSAANWTDYYDYDVGGNDVTWVSGGWHLVVLDANRTHDRTSGTAPTLTACRRIGVGFNMVYTNRKSNSYYIDAISYGSSYEIAGDLHVDGTNGITFNNNTGADTVVRLDGGSWITDGYENGDWIRIRNVGTGIDGDYQIQSAPTASTLTLSTGDFTVSTVTADTDAEVLLGITLEDVYQYDIAATTRYTGVITKSPDGAYQVNFPLIIGDVSGANDVWFRSSGEVIYLADQPLDPGTTDLSIQSLEDTGTTVVTFGDSTGTGDSRVGFAGSVITQDIATFAGQGYLDLDDTIDTMEFFGSTVLGLDGSCTFAADTSHLITSCLFVESGQVALGSTEARKLQFIGYGGTEGGALLWNENIDIESSQFYSNSEAIEHPSAAGTPYSYVGLTFAGNTYDVNNTATALTINQTEDGGGVASNATSYTGSTVTFVNTKTLKVTVKDVAGDVIENARVAIYALETVGTVTDGDELIDGAGGALSNASGIVQNTGFNYPGDVNVSVRVRKSSDGDTPKYKPLKSAQLITSAGLNVTVTMLEYSVLI